MIILDRHQRGGHPAIPPERIRQVAFLGLTKGKGADVIDGSITGRFGMNQQHVVLLGSPGCRYGGFDIQQDTGPAHSPVRPANPPRADTPSFPRQ
jgi:hypothetical protein